VRRSSLRKRIKELGGHRGERRMGPVSAEGDGGAKTSRGRRQGVCCRDGGAGGRFRRGGAAVQRGNLAQRWSD
jgi:hypothetical protein